MTGVQLEILGGAQVTAAGLAGALREPREVVIWSGHGAPGALLLSDASTVGPKWLATQLRQSSARIVVLSACSSGVTDPDTLQSFSYELSRQGITSAVMVTEIADRGAVIYNIELVRALRAGADVLTAHEVAQDCVRVESSETAAAIMLIPGMTNGNRAIMLRLDCFEQRLAAVESSLKEIKDILRGGPRRKT